MQDEAKDKPQKREYPSDKELAKRMQAALDRAPHVPVRKHGRLTWVSRELTRRGTKVTVETVRKWMAGEAQPRGANLDAVAALFDVDPGWLALGTAPAGSKREQSAAAISVTGAVHYVTGRMMLEGMTVALPDGADELAQQNAVDIYAIINARQRRLTISLINDENGTLIARLRQPAPGNDHIVVRPTNGEPEVYQLPADIIEKAGTVSVNFVEIHFEEAAGGLRAGGMIVLPLPSMRAMA